jgi:hypothetical protein
MSYNSVSLGQVVRCMCLSDKKCHATLGTTASVIIKYLILCIST